MISYLTALICHMLNGIRHTFNLASHINNQAIYLLKHLPQSLYRLCSLYHSLTIGIHRGNSLGGIILNSANQIRNLLSCCSRLFCQFANLLGNYRKATSLFTSSGCLNSRIKSQQIGLPCQIRNCIYDSTDFLRTSSQFIYQPGSGSYLFLYTVNLINGFFYHQITSLSLLGSLICFLRYFLSFLTNGFDGLANRSHTVCTIGYRGLLLNYHRGRISHRLSYRGSCIGRFHRAGI